MTKFEELLKERCQAAIKVLSDLLEKAQDLELARLHGKIEGVKLAQNCAIVTAKEIDNELLGALQQIAEFNPEQYNGCVDEWEQAHAFTDCQNIARAAIAKYTKSV